MKQCRNTKRVRPNGPMQCVPSGVDRIRLARSEETTNSVYGFCAFLEVGTGKSGPKP